MAGSVLGTLAVRLRADTAEFTKDLKGAEGSLTGVADTARKVAVAAGAAFATMSGIGLIAIKIAADFESGMVRVKAIAQATDGEFEQLKSSAMELATATQFTAREVAEGMSFMAMAGFKTNEVIGTMPSVLSLASAGMIDLGDAANITTNILTGMGLEVKQLAMVNDVLVSAMTGANVDTRMLGEAFKFVGPVAKSAGVSFKDITASIALLGNAGIQGSTAGTTLRFAIASLLKPSKEASEIIKRLGLVTKDSSGKLLSMTGIVEQLETSGASTADILGLFGLRAGPGMAALIEQGSDKLKMFVARLDESGGVAERISKENLDTLTGRLKILASGFEAAAISIGDLLIPAAKGIVSMAQGVVGWFNNLSDSTREWIVKIGVAATVIAGLVAGIATVVAVLPLIISGFATMVTVLATTIPIVAAVGVAVATAGVLMVGYREISKTTTSDIALMWKQLGNDISEAAGTTSDDVKGTWGDLVGWWDGVTETIGKTWDKMTDKISGAWDDAMDAIGKTTLGRLLDDVAGFADKILGAWEIVSKGITTFFRGAVTDITALWDWVANSYFGKIAGTIISVFVSIWKGILTVFIWPFKQAFSAITETIDFWGKKVGLIDEWVVKKTGLFGFFADAAGGGEGGAPDKPKQTDAAKASVAALRDLLKSTAGKAAGEEKAKDATKAYSDAIEESSKELAGFRKKIIALGDTMSMPLRALPAGTGLAAPAMPGAPGVEGAEDVAKRLAEEKKDQDKPPGGQTRVQAIEAAMDLFSATIISSAGELGEVMQSAMQGFQAGGPIGAFAAVIADLATRTESFMVSVQNANDAMVKIVKAFEPLAKNMKPLAALTNELLVIIAEQLSPVFEALQPVFDFLFSAVKGIAIVILNTIMGIGAAWNWIISGIEWLAGKLMIDLDLGNLKFNLNGVNRAIASLHDITVSSARAEQLRTEETEKATATIRALNESLTNVPEGFKVQAARYRAIDESQDIAQGTPGIQGGEQLTVNINVAATEEAAEAIVEILEERGYSTSGSRVAGGAFAVDTGGA